MKPINNNPRQIRPPFTIPEKIWVCTEMWVLHGVSLCRKMICVGNDHKRSDLHWLLA